MTARTRAAARFAAAALLIGSLMLAGCSQSPRGGADALPSQTPSADRFVAAADAVPAPKATGELVDGTEVDLASLWTARPLVLQFTSTWCTQCTDLESDLSALSSELGDDVLVVHIALDEPSDTIQTYLKDSDVTGPVLVDRTGAIWRDYAVKEPPMTALVDTSGGIVRMWPGGASGDQLREALATITAG
ncbi:TlpA family protein disulfide reductase [Microbacterium sp. NPDC057659]|uniref:TlpA family protein disulfide reductase n=1 Tax=Microbacterium sp. NPDC057659 TaxID=3346198 RepID=UPI0036713CFA